MSVRILQVDDLQIVRDTSHGGVVYYLLSDLEQVLGRSVTVDQIERIFDKNPFAFNDIPRLTAVDRLPDYDLWRSNKRYKAWVSRRQNALHMDDFFTDDWNEAEVKALEYLVQMVQGENAYLSELAKLMLKLALSL